MLITITINQKVQYHCIDFFLNNIQLFFLISGHRCFVCAPDFHKRSNQYELKSMFGNIKIPKCSHFHISRKDSFIQTCPKESNGCMTQFEGMSFRIPIFLTLFFCCQNAL